MINKAILLGRLGADPEIRYTPDGAQVVNINLATSRKFKDNSGTRQEETEWHRVVFFGKMAENAGAYLKKGSQVYIEGRIRTQKWKGQDDKDNYRTEIVGERLNFLNTGKKDENLVRQESNPSQDLPEEKFADYDDDIPF